MSDSGTKQRDETSSNRGTDTDIHKIVRKAYGDRVRNKGCCSTKKSCCSQVVPSAHIHRAAEQMGYSKEDIKDAPEDSNLGLGCGAPLKQADVKEGDVVLDLGSGAGFDAFLAANVVGQSGKVIGVDMTPEMVEKAQSNAARRDFSNVDFRLGQIEALPVESNSVDKIISNCVINLCPDKPEVFREAYRVLKHGGTVALSDICLTENLPEAVRSNLAAYVGCIAGASLLEDYMQFMRDAGFENVQATVRQAFDVLSCDDPVVKAAIDGVKASEEIDIENIKKAIVSASVVATKK